MTREPETLTELVAARVGVPGGMTYRKFDELAEAAGHKLRKSVLHKIAKGQQVIIDPSVVTAIADVLELPQERVQAAAAYQYTGLVPSEVGGALVLHDPAVDADTPGTEKEVRRQRERAQDAEG